MHTHLPAIEYRSAKRTVEAAYSADCSVYILATQQRCASWFVMPWLQMWRRRRRRRKQFQQPQGPPEEEEEEGGNLSGLTLSYTGATISRLWFLVIVMVTWSHQVSQGRPRVNRNDKQEQKYLQDTPLCISKQTHTHTHTNCYLSLFVCLFVFLSCSSFEMRISLSVCVPYVGQNLRPDINFLYHRLHAPQIGYAEVNPVIWFLQYVYIS